MVALLPGSRERIVGHDKGMALLSKTIETEVGPMCAVVDGDALVMLEFADPERLQPQMDGLVERSFGSIREGEHPLHSVVAGQLNEFFAGSRQEFDLPLKLVGTEFQKRVWELLLTIPFGQTRSYGDLARELGDPDLTRAVGMANGANRIAIVVPCHRVIGADGSLTGYGGGLWRKKRLLELEQGQRLLL